MEFVWSVFSPNTGKHGPEKFYIWALFRVYNSQEILSLNKKWDKVFKNGRTVFTKFEGIWSALGRPYAFKLFKGCISQVLLGLFLNTLPQMILSKGKTDRDR